MSSVKESLCVDCKMDIFIKCPYPHGRGRLKDMIIKPTRRKVKDKIEYGEIVTECPRFKKEDEAKKKCAYCRKEFVPANSRQRFCCKECQAA